MLCAASLHAQTMFDVPFVRTTYVVIDEMLRLAGVTERNFVMDLGSGESRISIRLPQAKSVTKRGSGRNARFYPKRWLRMVAARLLLRVGYRVPNSVLRLCSTAAHEICTTLTILDGEVITGQVVVAGGTLRKRQDRRVRAGKMDRGGIAATRVASIGLTKEQ